MKLLHDLMQVSLVIHLCGLILTSIKKSALNTSITVHMFSIRPAVSPMLSNSSVTPTSPDVVSTNVKIAPLKLTEVVQVDKDYLPFLNSHDSELELWWSRGTTK